MSASASKSETQQTTNNVDRSLNTGEGDILALESLTVNEGGSLTVVNKDPEAAYRAIDAIRETSANLTDAVLNSATKLAQGSNQIAAQVADSQKAFVEVASGQKAITYAVAIVGGVAVIIGLPIMIKAFRRNS